MTTDEGPTPSDVARYAIGLLGGSVDRAVAGMPVLRLLADDPAACRCLDLVEALAVLDSAEDGCYPRACVQAKVTPPKRHGWVYVIAAGPRIKVGFSADVSRRVAQLSAQTPYQVRLIATMPGSVDDEVALHERFAACRVHGEWFEPDVAMRAWLDELVS